MARTKSPPSPPCSRFWDALASKSGRSFPEIYRRLGWSRSRFGQCYKTTTASNLSFSGRDLLNLERIVSRSELRDLIEEFLNH